jgi:hypothetical protein
MKYSTKTNKGQSEIVGIAIVMVLIMIGLVFVINFVIMGSEGENIKVIYDRAQLASNAISSIIRTTTSCYGLTMTELLQDCNEKYGDISAQKQCPADSRLTGSCATATCNSCNFFNQTLQYLLSNSIDPLKTRYDLYICTWDPMAMDCIDMSPGDIIAHISYNSCRRSNATTIDAKQVPIPTNEGNKVAQIYVCSHEAGLI